MRSISCSLRNLVNKSIVAWQAFFIVISSVSSLAAIAYANGALTSTWTQIALDKLAASTDQHTSSLLNTAQSHHHQATSTTTVYVTVHFCLAAILSMITHMTSVYCTFRGHANSRTCQFVDDTFCGLANVRMCGRFAEFAKWQVRELSCPRIIYPRTGMSVKSPVTCLLYMIWYVYIQTLCNCA